jgi:hypothetical protein
LNGIRHATDRQQIAQNRLQEVTPKSYVELNRSRTTTQEDLSQMKSFGLLVKDGGLTASLEITTEGHPFDNSSVFQEPQSEKHFKIGDLFHLHGSSTHSDVNDDVIFTESPVKHNNRDGSFFGDDFKDESGEIDLTEDLGLSQPPTDVQFKDEDWHGGYRTSEMQDYVQPTESLYPLDRSKATTNLPTRKYSSGVASADSSQGFTTRKTHRFRTYTTALTPVITEPQSVQHMMNSNQKVYGEEVFTVNITSKPNTIFSDLHDGQSNNSPEELTRNDAITTRQPLGSWQTSIPTSPTDVPTKVSFITEKPVAKKVEPIFVEIIHRGSSEPPVLKTYTVEELEKRRVTTWSPLSTDKDSSSSSSPKETPVRSPTIPRGDMSSVLTVPPSPRRGRPRKKLISLMPVPDTTATKITTPIPPNTLHVTFNRKLQPSELTVPSPDPYDSNKMKSDVVPPDSSTFRTRSEFPDTEHTTPISPVTLSRRVQPPFESFVQFNSGSSIPASSPALGQDRQPHMTGTADREASTNFQARTNGTLLNIGSNRLPQETNFAQDIMVSNEPSTAKLRVSSEPTKNSAVLVEVRHQPASEPSRPTILRQYLLSNKQQTITEAVETTTSHINTSLEVGILTTEPTTGPDIRSSHVSKLEPTSSPQYRLRDGLEIPASSGPSTLHSLAVYFAAQDRNDETTIHTLTGFDITKHKGRGGKPRAESVPVATPTIPYGSGKEGKEEDTSAAAPSFLTKSTRDSYSELFPNTNEDQMSEVHKQVRPMKMTAGESDVKIKTLDNKTTPPSDTELRNELLDKLAEISEMELKTSNGIIIPSSQREAPHSDTEDLLQGTDSRDLRELAQIFSHALSAYLEDPEEFKKVLTQIRPKDPSSFSTDDVKQFQVNQPQSTTVGSVSLSTSVPLTASSTEYFSVTQEDEEVLDFSDVSKVSTGKSKSTTLVPSHSKYGRTEKLEDVVLTSYAEPTAVVTSANNGVTESTPESTFAEVLDEIGLKPPDEGLQNAQSAYYTSPNQQDATGTVNTVTVPSEMSEHPQAAEELGEGYTLPPGTKRYRGPGYGPQVGEVKFAPTAGGVNDASRPRYGGFQNNSRVTPKEASSNYTDSQVIALVPKVKYHTGCTEKPISETQNVERTSTKEVRPEIGNILNTFRPQELNNLAIPGFPQTSVGSMQKERVQPQNLLTHSKQAALGSSATTYTPLIASQPSDARSLQRMWSPLGSIADALIINHELSDSDIEGRMSSTTVQEIISSVTTTQNPSSSPKSVLKTRQRLSSIPDIWKPTAAGLDDEDQTATLPDIHGAFRSDGISTKSFSTQIGRHSQERFETESADSHEPASDNQNSKEEMLQFGISGVTFYSEKVKPVPPSSASLIQESVSRKSKVNALVNSSANRYLPENASVPNENSEEISIKTSLRDTSIRNEPTSITQPYSSTTESESTTAPPNTAMKNRLFPVHQGSRSHQESRKLGQGLIKNATLRAASDMSLLSRQSMPAPFSETPFPAETTIAPWPQEIKEPEQDGHNENLQPVQSLKRKPISSSTSRSRGASPSRRAKNATIAQQPYDGTVKVHFLKGDHFVMPDTSMSALGLLGSEVSVPFSLDNNTLSRGTKFSHQQKSLKTEFLPSELNNTSNFRQSVRIRNMIPSAVSSTSFSSPSIPTFSKVLSSDRSLTSLARTSLDTDLKLDNVTMDQLQALENLTTMLFSDEDRSKYGNLNESNAHSLINAMRKAVTNSTVRRLVLLLVSSFKESTPQETRSQLINALLRMPVDHKVSEPQQDSLSALLKDTMTFLPEKSRRGDAAVTLPGCKSHPSSDHSSSQHSVITEPNSEDKELTTAKVLATKFRTRGRQNPQAAVSQTHPITTVNNKGRRVVRIRVTTDSPQTTPSTTPSVEEVSQPEDIVPLRPSDTRAVELLQSLYSLASRWG